MSAGHRHWSDAMVRDGVDSSNLPVSETSCSRALKGDVRSEWPQSARWPVDDPSDSTTRPWRKTAEEINAATRRTRSLTTSPRRRVPG